MREVREHDNVGRLTLAEVRRRTGVPIEAVADKEALAEFLRFMKWEEYRKLMNEDERREYNRIKQAEYRKAKAGKNGAPLPGQKEYEDALERGDEAGAQEILDNQPFKGGVGDRIDAEAELKRVTSLDSDADAGG